VAKLTDEEISEILTLQKAITTKTTLEPFFLSKTDEGSLLFRGLGEGFFVEYIKGRRPYLRYSEADSSFFDYEAETGLFRGVLEPLLLEEILEELLRFRSATASVSHHFSERMEEFRNLNFAQKLVARLKGKCYWRGVWNRWKGGHYIHTLNKVLVLDLETGEFKTRRFSPKFNSIARIKIKYDHKADCPKFEEALNNAIPDPELRKLLLKCLGQMLIGANLAHKILVLKGKANTGKSAVATLIVDVIGAENCVEIRLTEASGRFELAQYRNATLLKAFDVPCDFLKNKNADVLKKLTGGDEVGGEQKFSGQVSYRGDKCVFLTTNFDLNLREGGDEAALARRLVVIEWNPPAFKKRNAKWPSYILKHEGGGVLNLLLGGLKMALQDLKEGHSEGFVKVESNEKAVDAVLAASNSVQRFVSLMVEQANGEHILVDEFHEAYSEFCGKHGIPAKSENIASKLFNDAVSGAFNAHKSRLSVSICGQTDGNYRPWCWKNIRLKVSEPKKEATKPASNHTEETRNGFETANFDSEIGFAEKVDY